MGGIISDVMGKNTTPPHAPDYVGAAQAQGAANKDAALASAFLSNPNISGPYGSQTVSYSTGPDGNYIPTVTQSLSPAQQQLLNQQNSLKMGLAGIGQGQLANVASTMGTPFNGSQYNLQTSFGPTQGLTFGANQGTNAGQNGSLDLSGIAKMPVNAGTTGFQAMMSRLQPQLDRTRTSLETQLTNQGLRPGDEAWGNAMRDYSNQANDALSQAANYGIGLDMSANNQGYNQALQSGNFANNAALTNANFENQANLTNANFANQAAAQDFNQALQRAQFGNTANQQAYQQALNSYNLPLNQLNALMSGSQVTNPQFQGYSGSTVTPGNIAGAVNQAGQYAGNLYSNQVAQQNAMLGGLAQLGGATMIGAGNAGGLTKLLPFLA